MRLLQSTKSGLLSLIGVGILLAGSPVNSHAIVILRSSIPKEGNPTAEAAGIVAAFPDLGPLDAYLGKFDEGSDWDAGGLFDGLPELGVSGGAVGPSATASWDLSGTGFILKAIGVKAGQEINVYEVDVSMGVSGSHLVSTATGKGHFPCLVLRLDRR